MKINFSVRFEYCFSSVRECFSSVVWDELGYFVGDVVFFEYV